MLRCLGIAFLVVIVFILLAQLMLSTSLINTCSKLPFLHPLFYIHSTLVCVCVCVFLVYFSVFVIFRAHSRM